jgi:pimeloyl-ACP methyl ester carboxylesterase
MLRIGDDSISFVLTRPDQTTNRGVLLIHGGPGGTKEGPSDLFLLLADSLAAVGVATVRFDMLGVGDSTGHYVDMTLAGQAEQVRSMNSYMSTQFDTLGVLGESLGAAALLNSLPLTLAAAALLWPAIDLPDTSLSAYLTPESQETLTSQGYVLEDGIKVGKAFIEEFQQIGDLYDRLNLLGVPTLLIHGSSDSEVPHSQSERAFELLNDPGVNKLRIVPNGEHCLRETDEQRFVVREVTNWFNENLH